MELFIPVLVLVAIIVGAGAIIFFRTAVIFPYQRGVLYRKGKFVKVLESGAHRYFTPWDTVQRVDMRKNFATVPGQEVLTADNVSIRISLAAIYEVSDPFKAMTKSANYYEALYMILQVSLRDAVGALDVEELLAKRAEIGKQVFENSLEQAAELGLTLTQVSIKDVMFPGELRTIFTQVVNARQQGLAALEKARGESAALRNLANAARLFDDHPNLLQLRLVQLLEAKSANSVMVMPPELFAVLQASKTGEK